MKQWILAVAVLLGGAVGMASADYIVIIANVGQVKDKPVAADGRPDGGRPIPAGPEAHSPARPATHSRPDRRPIPDRPAARPDGPDVFPRPDRHPIPRTGGARSMGGAAMDPPQASPCSQGGNLIGGPSDVASGVSPGESNGRIPADGNALPRTLPELGGAIGQQGGTAQEGQPIMVDAVVEV